MLNKLTLSAALVAAAAFLTPASAAPTGLQIGAAVDGAPSGLVQQVHWRHHHHRYYNYYGYYPGYYPGFWWHHHHHHHRYHRW